VLETFGSPSKFDRRFREGYTAVYCNTKPYIHKAKQAGIPVEIVCFEDDAYSKLKENVRAANETNSNLYILPGDHFTPQKEPVRFASDLDNIVKDRYVRL